MRSGDMARAQRWTDQRLLDAKSRQLPFSFTYAGRASTEFLREWPRRVRSTKLDANRTERTVVWTDASTGLQVRCVAVQHAVFPEVEWTLHLKNTGAKDTPIIAGVQALDAVLDPTGSKAPVLHHFRGDNCTKDSFQPLQTQLTPGKECRFAPAGGRPSSGEWPYFNVELDGGGLMMAIGWPGQWASRFSRGSGEGVHILAGQELTNFTLHPGEEVRTPLIALMFYKGDWITGQNLWRRWMLTQNFPKERGQAVSPKLAGFCGNYATEYRTDQKGELEFMGRYVAEGLALDCWWMDAGWYPCGSSWSNVGTWEVDRARFPGSLRAISDRAHAKKMKYILWFEPERVSAGSWLADHRPEWVLGGRNGGLVNLGSPDARTWITDRIDKIIGEEGVDIYRQDFNMDPLPYWRANDSPDRQGITEIKHVQGYLAFWDELLRRHPGMLIDSCASGGRRDDLESMRRAVPFLRSDYCTDPEGMQCHTYGFGMWLPYYRGATAKVDGYDWRSNLSPLMMPAWDMRDKALDIARARQLVAEWRQVAPLMLGDFYPLTCYSTGSDVWMAFQFDRPDQDKGLVQLFRRAGSAVESIRVKLRGLESRTTYVLTDHDAAATSEMTGRRLMDDGIEVTIKARPGTALITYAKKRAKT